MLYIVDITCIGSENVFTLTQKIFGTGKINRLQKIKSMDLSVRKNLQKNIEHRIENIF